MFFLYKNQQKVVMLDLLVNRDSLQQTDNCVIQTTFLIKLYYDSLELVLKYISIGCCIRNENSDSKGKKL